MRAVLLVLSGLGCAQGADIEINVPAALVDDVRPVYRLSTELKLGPTTQNPPVRDGKILTTVEVEPGGYELTLKFDGAASPEGRVLPLHQTTRGVQIEDGATLVVDVEQSDQFFDDDGDGLSNLTEISRGYDPDASPELWRAPVGAVGLGELYPLSDGGLLYAGPLPDNSVGLRVIEADGTTRFERPSYSRITVDEPRGRIVAVQTVGLVIQALSLEDGSVLFEIPFAAEAPDLAGAPWVGAEGDIFAPLAGAPPRLLPIDLAGEAGPIVTLDDLAGCTLTTPPFHNRWSATYLYAFGACASTTELIRLDGQGQLSARYLLTDTRAAAELLLAVGEMDEVYLPTAGSLQRIRFVDGSAVIDWTADTGPPTSPPVLTDQQVLVSRSAVDLGEVVGRNRADGTPGVVVEIGRAPTSIVAPAGRAAAVVPGTRGPSVGVWLIPVDGAEPFFYGEQQSAGFALAAASETHIFLLGNAEIRAVAIP